MSILTKFKEAQATHAFVARYGTHLVIHGKYGYLPTNALKTVKMPVAGAVAEFESGATVGGRTTLTRVAAGAIVAGPVGAIVGGLFRKDRNKIYVTTTFPDGKVVILEGPAKDESKLREFARKVNDASEHYSIE